MNYSCCTLYNLPPAETKSCYYEFFGPEPFLSTKETETCLMFQLNTQSQLVSSVYKCSYYLYFRFAMHPSKGC